MTRLRRALLARLLLAAAAGAGGHVAYEAGLADGLRSLEAAAVSAYASGVMHGWTSCPSCWERQ